MASVTPAPGLPPWSVYPRFVRRHRLVIAVLGALGLVAGFLWSTGQPTTYSATASVVLVPVPKYVTPSTVELVPPPVTIDTDAQLLRSPEVLAAVARETGVDVDSAGEHLSVTASPRTRVLHVTVSARSSGEAAAADDAAVAALADVRRRSLGSLGAYQARRLRGLVREHEQTLAEAQARGVVIPAYDDLTAQLLELEVGLDALDEARARPLEVVDPAVPPLRADYANTEVPLTSGAMAGLLCGCLAGAALDRTGRRRTRTTPVDLLRDSDPLRAPTDHEDSRHVV